MNHDQRIKEIDKEFTKLGWIDSIPMIMIGLGIHAKFGNSEEPAFAFLKNDAIVNGMFLVAVPVVLWCIVKASRLAIERNRLTRNKDA